MSAQSARSVRQTDGLEASRALQRVPYRSAKQDRSRRFHALYAQVARSDVLRRAWDDVRSNRGAPGVDGVTIAMVEDSGVSLFLVRIATASSSRHLEPTGPDRRHDLPGDVFAERRQALLTFEAVGVHVEQLAEGHAGDDWSDATRVADGE